MLNKKMYKRMIASWGKLIALPPQASNHALKKGRQKSKIYKKYIYINIIYLLVFQYI